jgi:hypothetical protein
MRLATLNPVMVYDFGLDIGSMCHPDAPEVIKQDLTLILKQQSTPVSDSIILKQIKAGIYLRPEEFLAFLFWLNRYVQLSTVVFVFEIQVVKTAEMPPHVLVQWMGQATGTASLAEAQGLPTGATGFAQVKDHIHLCHGPILLCVESCSRPTINLISSSFLQDGNSSRATQEVQRHQEEELNNCMSFFHRCN